ncbi:MAG: histidine phosphatase family protein [Ruminococcaceae bacterium]|nr:histidine phosphatase family protein [Oscillospiraceae bacterium]
MKDGGTNATDTKTVKRELKKPDVKTASDAALHTRISNSAFVGVEWDKTALKSEEGHLERILIVRHGESLGNAHRAFLGHTDKDLSERGYAQAYRTADFLSYEKIDVIYSSDLLRAYNTALPHAKLRGLDVISDKGLREIYAGDWEDKTVEEIIDIWGDEYLVGWRKHFGTYTIPGGESVLNLAERIERAMLEIARHNEGKTVLIACHAAAIRSFFGRISGIAPEELAGKIPFPTNASVSTVYFDGERLIPGEYSHDAHIVDLLGENPHK